MAMPISPTAVVAGNSREFKDFMRGALAYNKYYVNITNERSMMGLYFRDVIFIGSYLQSEDLSHLMGILRTRMENPDDFPQRRF